MPPEGNANYAWIQQFPYHLGPNGQTGFVLAKGSLTTKTSGEGDIRKELIERNRVDCIVNLPASLWFMSRNRSSEILFIDTRNLGHLITRHTKELTQDDIRQIADTYHNWRNVDGKYEDIPGFCASAPISKVKESDYALTTGRYVGLPDDEDDFNFNERFTALKAELEEQLKEEARLNDIIATYLSKIK